MRSGSDTPLERVPCQMEPTRSAPLSDTPFRLTPLRLTPLSDTPLRLTPLRLTPLSDTPLRLTPLSETPLRLTPLSETPLRLTPLSTTRSFELLREARLAISSRPQAKTSRRGTRRRTLSDFIGEPRGWQNSGGR